MTVSVEYLLPELPDACAMAADDEFLLLAAVMGRPDHVLTPFFPLLTTTGPYLRRCPPDFILLEKDDNNFISRVLFRTLYH